MTRITRQGNLKKDREMVSLTFSPNFISPYYVRRFPDFECDGDDDGDVSGDGDGDGDGDGNGDCDGDL